MPKLHLPAFVLTLLVATMTTAAAANWDIKDEAELRAAVGLAADGDTITLKDIVDQITVGATAIEIKAPNLTITSSGAMGLGQSGFISALWLR